MHFGQGLNNWPESRVVETIEAIVPEFRKPNDQLPEPLPGFMGFGEDYDEEYEEYDEPDDNSDEIAQDKEDIKGYLN